MSKILVVDDEVQIRTLLSRMLESCAMCFFLTVTG